LATNIWKKDRKTLHSFLTPKALKQHYQMQEIESIQLLFDLVNSPKDTYTHICHLAMFTMFSLIYGQWFPKYCDSVPEAYFKGIKLLNQTADPGAHPLVDILPFLKFIPGKWKEMCRVAKQVHDQVYVPLLKDCEEKVRSGEGQDSFIGKVIMEREKRKLGVKEIGRIGAMFMDAGAETTSSYLLCVFMSLILYPDFQKIAQNEIDDMIGNQIPTLKDIEKLPYLNAFLKEVMRFIPILPIGIPHVSTEDVMVCSLPSHKFEVSFYHSGGIYHNHDLFPNPDVFIPEQYLISKDHVEPKVQGNLVFGAGRQICPGEHIAMQVVHLNVMRLLWAFSFEKDGSGTGSIEMSAFMKVISCMIYDWSHL
ncbi:cytochrome P450, partial [Cyathus striatus]